VTRALVGVVVGVLLTMCAALLELRRVADGGDPHPVSVGVGVVGLALSTVSAGLLVAPEQRRQLALAAGLPFLLVGLLTAVLLLLR
jgi:hypothetical protein